MSNRIADRANLHVLKSEQKECLDSDCYFYKNPKTASFQDVLRQNQAYNTGMTDLLQTCGLLLKNGALFHR